jgi:uncharacterized protein YjbI with pentapeptide repeats
MSSSTVITIAALGLAAAVVLLGAWWLWWRLPKRQVDRLRLTIRDPKARADVEDNFRKTIGQLLGGAAVLIGAGLAYLQFTQQQQASQQQFLQQQQASRDLLISNQVAKGFEQLGSDKIVVRLGGIYALEGVMNGSEQYHQPVLEALSAFVRDGTGTETGDGPPATDIQAALTVIGRRAIGAGFPDLENVNIPKANLFGANLTDADLDGANLTGTFMTSANLTGANLFGANLIDVMLVSANLTGVMLASANLTGTNMDDANLRGAILFSVDATGTPKGANLTGTQLNDADLRGAKITQAQLDQACGKNAKLDPGLTLKPCP